MLCVLMSADESILHWFKIDGDTITGRCHISKCRTAAAAAAAKRDVKIRFSAATTTTTTKGEKATN